MQTRLELYQGLTPLAGLGIFERNLTTGEIYWNEIIRSILDVDSDYLPMLDQSINFYHKPEHVRALIDKAIASGTAASATLQLTSAAGKIKWVELRIQAQCEAGRCVRLYGTMKEVTGHVKMVALLEEREKLFTLAFDHAPIGMALVSPSGVWIKVNSSLCKMLSYPEVELLQRRFQDITHPDDLDKDLRLLQKLVDDEIKSYSMEKRYFTGDGRIIWVTLNVSIVRDDNGHPMYFVAQITDITDKIKAHELIRQQNSRLLNFANIVSHNLRSHTGNMKMLTEMILKETHPQERDELLQMLNANSGNLLETLEHLNEIVKVNNSDPIQTLPINLKIAVNRVLDILAGSVRNQNADISIDIPEEIGVHYNPAYLESILINLISNSLKYKAPERNAVICIQAKRLQQSTQLKVSDNGQGIDMALHGHKIFGMYKTFHDHPDSRGIGLFLIKNQVEAMGGTISVESEPNVGTTFIVNFSEN